MKTLFHPNELPIEQLKELGIYHQDQLLLNPQEIQALLCGRRTDFISLREFKASGFEIERLDARLSLQRDQQGKVNLLIHPIYRDIKKHPLLDDLEMQELIEGKKHFIGKSIQKEEGRYSMLNIEYDSETKEFISYDVSSVQAPDLVNGMLLSQEEKSAFKRGEVLTMPDGTQLRHRAAESLGVLSDRKALIFSVLLDGGISYLILRGIRALNQGQPQVDYKTPSFLRASDEMQGQPPLHQENSGFGESLSLSPSDRTRSVSR